MKEKVNAVRHSRRVGEATVGLRECGGGDSKDKSWWKASGVSRVSAAASSFFCRGRLWLWTWRRRRILLDTWSQRVCVCVCRHITTSLSCCHQSVCTHTHTHTDKLSYNCLLLQLSNLIILHQVGSVFSVSHLSFAAHLPFLSSSFLLSPSFSFFFFFFLPRSSVLNLMFPKPGYFRSIFLLGDKLFRSQRQHKGPAWKLGCFSQTWIAWKFRLRYGFRSRVSYCKLVFLELRWQ